uniref:GST N-terminal domain-containing protein n=1 Tax=Cyclophora tenuis TaxID=216820 RepID=A0A7S1CY25_CYCTE|mmetsp:Transcript_14349/g.24394  ORF Transcript_14349/g.24394 Transcript_14349/m.24394 type:complete len:274 (+) Transcript_14349:2-823(+)
MAFRQLRRLRIPRLTPQHRLFSDANPSSFSPPSVTLYQYAICPFCNKVKALLNHVGLHHEIVEVNPLTKSELPKGDYRKVPIALVDEQAVLGSDAIISALLEHRHVQEQLLNTRWKDADNMTLEAFQQDTKWLDFATNQLATLMYPNICRSVSDAYRSFDYVSDVPTWSAFQKFSIRGVGSIAMYMAASRVKKKYNIEDERKALEEALQVWYNEALNRDEKQFASGANVPNLADLTVYGTLRSVEGLEAHDTFVRNGPVSDWYQRMKEQTNNM